MDKAAPPTTTTTSSSTTNQTHDFMNVDSFSQLPFIRPSPTTTKASASISASAIRLFGIDFSSSTTSAATENSDSGESTTNTHQETINKDTAGGGIGSGESSRKFECHYCCRNFPTSQALGGHQNAHKRERQHAKRAHLHSAMISADHHHLYHHYNHRPPPNPYLYPSSYSTGGSRYSYNYSQPPTINGSPLAMWRVPPGIHRDRSLPLFSGSAGNDNPATKSMSMSMNTTTVSGYDGANGHDHVSLDLHL